jgi:beta-N-acetylhexosaminidase
MYVFCRKKLPAWILFFLIGPFPDLLTAQESVSKPIDIDISLKQMSLDDKVGQLLMIGFPQSVLDSRLKKHIQKIHASSFILFKRNIENLSQVVELNRSLKSFVPTFSPVPPLIAIDQEGGAVARIATIPAVPTAFSVGLTNNPTLAYELGLEVGKILKNYGFNMNLAPVLDLTNLTKPNFIGLRSFSAGSETAATMGTQYSKGLIQSGVLPTAKHFPGMTSINQDPHLELISSPRSAQEFRHEDVIPYLRYFELGPLTAIMMSHLIYPALDPTKTPAIYSRVISHDLLRTELGFSGLVITDDIQMRSSDSSAKTWTNAIDSLKAGADILILSWSFRDQEKTFFEIKRSVELGIIPMKDLDEKVKRILHVKRGFSKDLQSSSPQTLTSPHTPIQTPPTNRFSLAEPNKIHYSAKLEELTQKILETNILNILPEIKSPPQNYSVCVYSSNNHFSRSFNLEKNLSSQIFQLKQETKPKNLALHIKKNHCSLNLIPVYGRLTTRVMSEIKDPELIQKTIVINFSHPTILSGLWPEKQTIQIGHHFANSGIVLARTLSKIKNQRVAQAASPPEPGRAPAAQTPNSGRPKSP